MVAVCAATSCPAAERYRARRIVHYFARMVKKKLAFVFGVFCATVLLMAVQKPVFLAYYAADAAQASAGEWLGVVWHGLTLDSTVAGYVAALPLLLTLASLWVRFPERIWRRVLNVYFVLIAVLTAAIFAVDLNLYGYWGFRLDGSVLIYLSDPGEALASASWGEVLRQILIMLVYAGAMIWSYRWILRLFRVEPVPLRGRVVPTVAALLIGKAYRAAELGIRFVLDPASELHGDGRYLPASSLITILGNLIENAFDALRNAPETAQKEVTVSIREGEHGMLISVDDSGAGIAADKLDRIFERGFSTKGEGRGTGLSLVKETVDAFHGTIRVESEPGIGSSFIITVAESANGQQ